MNIQYIHVECLIAWIVQLSVDLPSRIGSESIFAILNESVDILFHFIPRIRIPTEQGFQIPLQTLHALVNF